MNTEEHINFFLKKILFIMLPTSHNACMIILKSEADISKNSITV